MRKASSLLAVLVLLMGPAAARPASPAQRIDKKVRRAIKHFPGTVYLFAKNLDSGESYGLRADERVRTASTIKLSIMVTAFAAVEQGGARWNEELTLRESEKISGSGVLHELSDGVKLPLGDLVRLMIVVSDNTATNLLIDRFTADAVNQQMDRLGLAETRCLRKVRGDGPASGWSQAGRAADGPISSTRTAKSEDAFRMGSPPV